MQYYILIINNSRLGTFLKIHVWLTDTLKTSSLSLPKELKAEKPLPGKQRRDS